VDGFTGCPPLSGATWGDAFSQAAPSAKRTRNRPALDMLVLGKLGLNITSDPQFATRSLVIG
jgi:hypothetical protein